MTGEPKQSMQNHMKLIWRIAYCVLMIVTVLFIILLRVDRLNYHNTGYYQIFPSLNIRHLTATAKEAETFFAEGNKVLALIQWYTPVLENMGLPLCLINGFLGLYCLFFKEEKWNYWINIIFAVIIYMGYLAV